MSEASHPSRRTVIAAVPALAVTLPLGAQAFPINPDIKLLRLGAELEKAHASVKAAVKSGNDYPADFVFTDDIVAEKMIEVRATTIRGLKTKVRALFIALGLPEEQWNTPERWRYSDINDGLTLSIMEDILAMETGPRTNAPEV